MSGWPDASYRTFTAVEPGRLDPVLVRFELAFAVGYDRIHDYLPDYDGDGRQDRDEEPEIASLTLSTADIDGGIPECTLLTEITSGTRIDASTLVAPDGIAIDVAYALDLAPRSISCPRYQGQRLEAQRVGAIDELVGVARPLEEGEVALAEERHVARAEPRRRADRHSTPPCSNQRRRRRS